MSVRSSMCAAYALDRAASSPLRPDPRDAGAAPLLGQPDVRHGRELELAEHHRRAGRCRSASAVAIAAMAVEAFGITAISSASAPIEAAKARAQPLDLADPAIPRRAVASCHDSVNAASAASTSSDSAPCEQLFT